MNKKCAYTFDVLADDLKDCVVFSITNSDVIISVHYISPSGSEYEDSIQFDYLKLICSTYNSKSLFCIGDFNSRTSTPTLSNNSKFAYLPNPDSVINSHGHKLLDILSNNSNMFILNGLCSKDTIFESKFTFLRGSHKSQNDLCISNCPEIVKNFEILAKNTYSDHCPLKMHINFSLQPPMSFIDDCNQHFLSYEHYDINHRLLKPVNFKNIDPVLLFSKLQQFASNYVGLVDNDELSSVCHRINTELYSICQACIRSNVMNTSIHVNPNCDSRNFKAIADAHLNLYISKYLANEDYQVIENCAQNWWFYHQLAIQREKSEYNFYKNQNWRYLDKNDGRKFWKQIDWKGNSVTLNTFHIDPNTIDSYFRNIFQSSKLASDPIVSDIRDALQNHNIIIPALDNPFSLTEVCNSLNTISNGVSFDGISPSIANYLPDEFKSMLTQLFNRVFVEEYPAQWEQQLLTAIPKKGHSENEPKLRGIATSDLLPRLYDDLLNTRFLNWYTPNSEQAGFRKLQGSTIQLFYVILCIELSNHFHKDLYFVLIDYEKAFDFANRATIITDMIDKGIGTKYIQAVAKMYDNSVYIPKISSNRIGNKITTKFGVTQGRKSSTSYFSFLVSDMHNEFNTLQTNDFLEGDDLAQMADDTLTAGDSLQSISDKFDCIIKFSESKHQHINVDKTCYIQMNQNPNENCITTSNNHTINAIKKNNSTNYLGFHLTPTNSRNHLIVFNIKKRLHNFAKFHVWLEANETTPILIKIRVLDMCCISSVIYGCETWGDIQCIKSILLKHEIKALKHILGVKTSTSNNLIYQELHRHNIISRIKLLQFKFINRLNSIHENDSTTRRLWQRSSNLNLNIHSYYSSLSQNCTIDDINSRKNSIINSNKTMDIRYRDLFNLNCKSYLYCSYFNDNLRRIITRWRLSSHHLAIETGRHQRPIIPRYERLCKICLIVEDETHVLLLCPIYTNIRSKFPNLFLSETNITTLLNPMNNSELNDTALYIKEIENYRLKHNL